MEVEWTYRSNTDVNAQEKQIWMSTQPQKQPLKKNTEPRDNIL